MSYSQQDQEENPSIVHEPDMNGTYTAKDYLQWQFEGMVELIKGKIFKMSPAPTSWHQEISTFFTVEIGNRVRRTNCKLFVAPFDVYLTNTPKDYKTTSNIVQPDLCVICDISKIKEFGCVGAPDFVIEILSTSTRKKDLTHKKDLYEEFGVQEYWIVSPQEELIIVNLLNENGKYETKQVLTVGSTVSPQLFPDLNIELEDVFNHS